MFLNGGQDGPQLHSTEIAWNDQVRSCAYLYTYDDGSTTWGALAICPPGIGPQVAPVSTVMTNAPLDVRAPTGVVSAPRPPSNIAPVNASPLPPAPTGVAPLPGESTTGTEIGGGSNLTPSLEAGVSGSVGARTTAIGGDANSDGTKWLWIAAAIGAVFLLARRRH